MSTVKSLLFVVIRRLRDLVANIFRKKHEHDIDNRRNNKGSSMRSQNYINFGPQTPNDGTGDLPNLCKRSL